jgi:LPXTG-motif cell wall-anchored protein
MQRRFVALGLVLALTTLGVATFPTTAFAATTCYTGCTTTSVTNPSAPTTAVIPHVTAPPATKATSSSGGLALTGADIEAMAVVGAGALVLGGLMVRRSRRRHRAAT